MNAIHAHSQAHVFRPTSRRSLRERAALGRIASLAVGLVLAACGGADAPPPPEGGTSPPVAATPPTITQQPASAGVTVGQTATFTVAATGTAPLAYQWQRNGTAIAGATTTSYTTPATVLGDSGAVFRAVVSNVAGSASSNSATLTVTASAPVLTIAPQPASTSVVAGTSASFSVGGTCSSGTLALQWQRNTGAAGAFVAIAGATSATHAFVTTASDTGAQFRAVLDCSGQSAATSNVATLTVTGPASVTLAALPVVGLRAQARILNPAGIDRQADGSYVFVTQNRLKRLSADLSTITVVAGVVSVGSLDGPAAAASFNGPQGVTHDGAGNLYVADAGNHTIRKVAVDGTVSTLAGSAGATGAADGTGTAARFNAPYGIAIGPDGDLYVADSQNNAIRRVSMAGVVTTYAGSGSGYLDGPASSAQFTQPRGVAIAGNGDLYVADYGNRRVRRVLRSGTAAGLVGTLAGSGGVGAIDGIGTAAQIAFPSAIVLDGNTLIVGDESPLLRAIDLTTTAVTTLAGTPYAGGVTNSDGGKGTGHFNGIAGIAAIPGGGHVVTDAFTVRRVSSAGVITTIATYHASDFSVEGMGVLAQIPLYMGPDGRTQQLVEPDKSVVVADAGTRIVRRIAPNGTVSLVAGLVAGSAPALDGKGSEAQFQRIAPIGRDASGTLYVTDDYGVRKITTDGTVSFLAGSPTAFGFADGTGAAAKFSSIGGMAVSASGHVFLGDQYRIRRVDPAGNVTTVAGGAISGQVDGPVATATFQFPTHLTFGADGTLYVVDASVLRRISADGTQVSTLSGITVTGGFAIDAAGTLYYFGVNGPGGDVGVRMRTTAGVDTMLVPQGPSTVLGASPAVVFGQSIVVYGPKQLLIQSQSQLLIATLP